MRRTGFALRHKSGDRYLGIEVVHAEAMGAFYRLRAGAEAEVAWTAPTQKAAERIRGEQPQERWDDPDTPRHAYEPADLEIVKLTLDITEEVVG